jgi:hypothetical protein
MPLCLCAGPARHARQPWLVVFACRVHEHDQRRRHLLGALTANAAIRRLGLFNTVRISAVACVLSLVLSALTGQVVIDETTAKKALPNTGLNVSAAVLVAGVVVCLAYAAFRRDLKHGKPAIAL